METGNSLPISDEAKQYPVKCDACSFTGTVADTKVVDGKVFCPQCGGALSSNTVADRILEAAEKYGVLGSLSNGDDW